jgi:RNA-directed DNA polymerase
VGRVVPPAHPLQQGLRWIAPIYGSAKQPSERDTQGKPLGFKTLIKPSKEGVKRHTLTIKGQLRRLRSASQEEVIKDLNPIIWGWAAYYKTANASRTFKRCDHMLWGQLMGWAIGRHRGKGARWVVEKYWHRVGKRKWVFATPKNAELRMHSKTPIQRYTKVKGMASPYDGNTLYWSQRLKTHPLMHETKARLLRKQQGKCRWCELYFKDGDVMEIDHLARNRNNNDLRNKMLLHRHCHDERHAKLAETEKIRKRLADAGIHIQ